MEFPDARIMVFAKAPVAGTVKTRLIPTLGEQEATALHRRLCLHTLHTALNAALCPVQLWCAPDCGHPFFRECVSSFALSLHAQSGSDLGARMHHAFAEALRESNYALIIGTDCPALTRDDLSAALSALAHGREAVIGPAEDGGYVLLGLRKPAPGLFIDIPWGGAEVLALTRARLRQSGMNWHELAECWDVDRAADVLRLHHEALLK